MNELCIKCRQNLGRERIGGVVVCDECVTKFIKHYMKTHSNEDELGGF